MPEEIFVIQLSRYFIALQGSCQRPCLLLFSFLKYVPLRARHRYSSLVFFMLPVYNSKRWLSRTNRSTFGVVNVIDWVTFQTPYSATNIYIYCVADATQKASSLVRGAHFLVGLTKRKQISTHQLKNILHHLFVVGKVNVDCVIRYCAVCENIYNLAVSVTSDY